jgi:hypothetical protein
MIDDEGKLYDAISRASVVNALLENGELNRALEEMKTQLIDLWMQSPTKDVVGREKLHMAVNQIYLFKERLRIVLDNGKLAQVDLNARSKRAAA